MDYAMNCLSHIGLSLLLAPGSSFGDSQQIVLSGTSAVSAYIIGSPTARDSRWGLMLGEHAVYSDPQFQMVDEDGVVWGGLLSTEEVGNRRVQQPRWFKWTPRGVFTTDGADATLGIRGSVAAGEWHTRPTKSGFELLRGGFETPATRILARGDSLPDSPDVKLTDVVVVQGSFRSANREGWAILDAVGQVPGLSSGRFSGSLYLMPSGHVASARGVQRFCEQNSLAYTGAELTSLCPDGVVVWGIRRRDDPQSYVHVRLGEAGEISLVEANMPDVDGLGLRDVVGVPVTDSRGWCWASRGSVICGMNASGEAKVLDLTATLGHNLTGERRARVMLHRAAALPGDEVYAAFMEKTEWVEAAGRGGTNPPSIGTTSLVILKDGLLAHQIDLSVRAGGPVPGVESMQFNASAYSVYAIGERAALFRCAVSEPRLDSKLKGDGYFAATASGVRPMLVPGMSVDLPGLGTTQVLEVEVLKLSRDARFLLSAVQVSDPGRAGKRTKVYLLLEAPPPVS